jgi:hypothetical protein
MLKDTRLKYAKKKRKKKKKKRKKNNISVNV